MSWQLQPWQLRRLQPLREAILLEMLGSRLTLYTVVFAWYHSQDSLSGSMHNGTSSCLLPKCFPNSTISALPYSKTRSVSGEQLRVENRPLLQDVYILAPVVKLAYRVLGQGPRRLLHLVQIGLLDAYLFVGLAELRLKAVRFLEQVCTKTSFPVCTKIRKKSLELVRLDKGATYIN